ncbi:MAG TPA: hypothetical protein VJ799_09440 [Nitrososphaeraceae archaeon]|nr:hypothetical protein [Nitrososphaeraceae archaeon]
MIDRRLSDRADAFIEKYYNDEYITDHRKAEECHAIVQMERQYKNLYTVFTVFIPRLSQLYVKRWIVEGDNNIKEESFEVIQQIRRLLTVRT